METEVLVKLNPDLAAWTDQRAREAKMDVSTLLAIWAEEQRQRASADDKQASLIAKLREKYPPSPELEKLRGSLRLNDNSDDTVEALKEEYLREKYGL